MQFDGVRKSSCARERRDIRQFFFVRTKMVLNTEKNRFSRQTRNELGMKTLLIGCMFARPIVRHVAKTPSDLASENHRAGTYNSAQRPPHFQTALSPNRLVSNLAWEQASCAAGFTRGISELCTARDANRNSRC
jgi:hypothetical protein